MYPLLVVFALVVLIAIIGTLPLMGTWGLAAIAIIVAALLVPWTQAE